MFKQYQTHQIKQQQLQNIYSIQNRRQPVRNKPKVDSAKLNWSKAS